MQKVRLGAKQQQAVNLARAGHSLFLTGDAGTGKSFTLEKIIQTCLDLNKRIEICGTTGAAATLIGGRTVHSLVGMNDRKLTPRQRVEEMYTRNYPAYINFSRLDALFMDEISMMDKEFFEDVDTMCRLMMQLKHGELRLGKVRDETTGRSHFVWTEVATSSPPSSPEDSQPYRGLGVKRSAGESSSSSSQPLKRPKISAAAAPLVRNASVSTLPFGGLQVIVTGDFYQLAPITKGSAEPVFAFESLIWKRLFGPGGTGRVVILDEPFRQSTEDTEFLKHLRKIRVGEVDEACVRFFAALSREPESTMGIKPVKLYSFNASVDAENAIQLDKIPGPVHTFTSKFEPASDAAAMTAKEAYYEGKKAFPNVLEKVQLKVGAQVMMTTNHLMDEGVYNGMIGRVTEIPEGADTRRLTVEFPVLGPKTISIVRLVKYSESGYPWLVCHTMPLKLASAITIHKSQGMSLTPLFVNLSDCKNWGQAYVALSRAKNSAGLQVIGFTRFVVRCSPKVKAFYAALERSGG